MKIHTVKVGELKTNCYIVEDEASKTAFIVDPGGEADKILTVLRENKLSVKGIVITHDHFDHVGALAEIEKATGAKAATAVPGFEVLCTPGHTKDGLCLYSKKEKVLFSGDTLFFGTWGRTDLPGSSAEEMKASLKRLLALPPKTKVYPGHGKPTTIGAEANLLDQFTA